jgi:diacylglycerol kinase family enzyme
VAVLSPHTVGHWLALAWGVLRRRPRVPRMETFRAKRVSVSSNRAQPRELDGDLIAPGRLLEVSVEPAALLVCVPAPSPST